MIWASVCLLTDMLVPLSFVRNHTRTCSENGEQVNVYQANDVNDAQTTYNYANATSTCGNAFPSSINEPLNLSRSFTWNCAGGVNTQVTDENGNNVSSSYTDPDFWRPASVTDQMGNQTSLNYYVNPTATEATLNFNGTISTSDVRTTLDGFGRAIFNQRLQTQGGSNYDTGEIDYNSLGQPYISRMPYSATASPSGDNTSAPATTTTYDALGRVVQTQDADGGYVSYKYTNNDVLQTVSGTPSGTQSFQKQFEYDGLGRLTSVCEINVSGNLPNAGTCGQNTSQNGYWTKYTYDALGHLLTVTQNAQAASGSQQTRSFTYDLLGRMTAETNPETGSNGASGTINYTYDSTSSSTCGSTPALGCGDLVQKKDNAKNITNYTYDALHRVLTAGNSTISGATLRAFVYDSTSGTPPSGWSASTANPKTRMIEATTTNTSSTVLTDEWFSYDKDGRLTDVFQKTPDSGGYYHSTASYWPNGVLNTLSLLNSSAAALIPAQTYGVDGEGRPNGVAAASGQNPVTSVTYSSSSTTNPLGALTNVTFGSGDSDAFTYDPNTGRMGTYTFSVNSKTDVGTLTWSANGTLTSLVINDQIPSTADSQTCTYGYDDLQRVSNVTCGTFWVQNFTYDAFGNITKNVPGGDGGLTFQPTYLTSPHPTNQFLSLPGVTPQYDANGNLLTDNLNTYTWDPNWGTMLTVTPSGGTTVTATYDALGRMVENNAGGTWTEFVYGPTGKLAKCNGQTLIKALIALPGGAKAIYNSSGLAYYRHSDWLGSSRLTSTATAPTSMYSSSAYAPFGEQYATVGSTDASYTGQDQDTVSSLYDFPARRQSPSQGRWISPDPAGRGSVTLTNPQTWNRYAYVNNNPLRLVDPLGMFDCNADPFGDFGDAYTNYPCGPGAGDGSGGGDDNSGNDSGNPPDTPPNSSDCLGLGAGPSNPYSAPPSNDPTAPAGLVPTSNSPIPVQGVGLASDGSGGISYYSGNVFQYQLVDGTGLAMNQAGIPIGEVVEGTDQNGNPYYYYPQNPQPTGSAPGTGPGQIDDFVGTETPGFLPSTGFSSLTTTQTWFATWQGQNIGLTPVYNQQQVTVFGITDSCVTPVGQ
jgi:RHS repeat-associated protein